MYLKRLTVSGFKSFAGKTELEFEPGITAIVGPNGSGKSNIADAVRWVLGEQSVKQLRTKKSDDLVFAGTDKRARASLAEVSLLLDNSDGVLPLDFSEIELGRVVYRSGESEYRLNGRKARLTEIQHLLAAAGFGQSSYTVIAQGMIDNFIISSPAERKLLFDEASGIRQYELKREQALKKLEATAVNLDRIRDVIRELEPRVEYLSKAVAGAKEREAIRLELSQGRADYVATAQHHHHERQERISRQLGELAEAQQQLNADIAKLEQRKQGIDQSQPQPTDSAAKLRELEVERDELANEVSVKKAELQFLREKLDEQNALSDDLEAKQAALSEAHRQTQQLQEALVTARKAEADAAQQLERMADAIRACQAGLSDLRDQMRETSSGEYIKHALSILRHASRDTKLNLEQVRDLISRAGRLLLNASFGEGDLIMAIKRAQHELSEAMRLREEGHNVYTNTVIKVRAAEMDVAASTEAEAALRQQITDLEHQSGQRQKTQHQIDLRIGRITAAEDRLKAIDAEVKAQREAVSQQSDRFSATAIFELATELESKRNQLRDTGEQSDDLRREQTELSEQIANVERMAGEWLVGSVPVGRVVSGSLEPLQRKLAVLEGRLAEGDSDAAVEEEFRETSERHQFLTGQVNDLDRAKSDLEQVIGQLDKLIKAKFQIGFEAIARHFSQNFERLFGGGSASLSLRPGDDGVYGIDIKATPPGKRVESLATLSGGERALTGIALLAAILESNPSPFVVMDEVDAALDEANSARLGSILRDIAKKSQLIVVTHNRAVMQAAHSIYGVTMDEHHVSRMLSVKLEEAKELATAE